MKKWILVAAMLAAFSAHAGNDNSSGGCQGNCSGGGSDVTANGGNGYGGNGYGGAGGDASATGVGIGLGVGLGGEGGQGGQGGRGGDGGSAVAFGGTGGGVYGSGNSSNLNSNKAEGGSAHQAQGQQQSASSDQSQSQGITSTIGATGSGNQTSVGGQSTSVSYRNERSAPPVFLGNMAPTVSCAGGFNAGASSQGGSGAFGFTWISEDCKQVVAGQNMLAAGETRLACEVFRQTDGFKRATRRNPALNEISCK